MASLGVVSRRKTRYPRLPERRESTRPSTHIGKNHRLPQPAFCGASLMRKARLHSVLQSCFCASSSGSSSLRQGDTVLRVCSGTEVLGSEFAKEARIAPGLRNPNDRADRFWKTRVVELAVAPGVPPGLAVVAVARSGEDGDAAECVTPRDAENIRRRAAERAERPAVLLRHYCRGSARRPGSCSSRQ
jgi:hypothetical protein